jgi:hypothetical protein
MPLQQLQQLLPKPILFGLYGAIGGLLGALLLGEILWGFLRPAAHQAKPTPPVQIAASEAVSVFQRGKNVFPIKLARKDYDAAVSVTGIDLPKGIKIDVKTLAGDVNESNLTIEASPDAVVGTSTIKIQASGASKIAENTPTGETTLQLTVLRYEPPPPALRLAASSKVVLERDTKNALPVKIARDRFTGPVQLEAKNLPPGVSILPLTLEGDVTSGELSMRAAEDAQIGPAEITLSGVGPEGVVGETIVKLEVEAAKVPMVDIMFALDVTGSMGSEIVGVSKGIVSFVKDLKSRKLDTRVGMLGFRDRLNGEEPELLKFDDSPFTSDAEAFSKKVATLKATGGGDIPESVLDALVECSRQPWREGALRVILMICDANPKVPDKEVKSLAECTKILRDAKIAQLHLVINKEHQRAYSNLKADIKGEIFDLNALSRGEMSLDKAMPNVSREIAKLVPPSDPPVKPVPPPTPPASKDASNIAPPASAPVLKSVQSDVAFANDTVTQTQLLIALGGWTGTITAMICLMLVVGQNFYLQKAWPSGVALVRGFAGGLLAGVVGGVVGQYLFQLLPLDGLSETGFRVLGWALLGALAGFGLAFFVPNLKLTHGTLGGLIGGVGGAIGFVLITEAVRGMGIDFVARLLGATVLGFAIGMMVAIAERLFRSYWLEVKLGASEQITVNLGPEPIKIGSDAKSCRLYAKGVASVAMRWWIREGKILCEDVPNKQTTEVPIDTSMNVGNLVLTVRSATVKAQEQKPVMVEEPPAAMVPRVSRPIEPEMASADACPKCGKVHPGPAGRRYCVAFDYRY